MSLCTKLFHTKSRWVYICISSQNTLCHNNCRKCMHGLNVVKRCCRPTYTCRLHAELGVTEVFSEGCYCCRVSAQPILPLIKLWNGSHNFGRPLVVYCMPSLIDRKKRSNSTSTTVDHSRALFVFMNRHVGKASKMICFPTSPRAD
jgi:hypothetical protein